MTLLAETSSAITLEQVKGRMPMTTELPVWLRRLLPAKRIKESVEGVRVSVHDRIIVTDSSRSGR